MTVTYRKAITSEAKPLVGLYSESGCGKTYSALLIAKGFVGDMSKVAMIETEAGRGEAYADDPVVGGYNVFPIRGEFSPKVYGQAISAAEKEGFQAVITDSASHEWEGIGGVLSMAAANQEAGKKGVMVWQQPKIQHAREFMLRLQQTPIPLVIVCMRAKYPMYEVTEKHVELWERAGRPGGKPPKVGEWARMWQLEPKQSDDILFEMFVHGWIDQDHRFHGTKYTRDVMRQIFVDGEPISVDTGKRLQQWASGRTAAQSSADTLTRMQTAAAKGTQALQDAWKAATAAERTSIGKDGLETLKRAAAEADRNPPPGADDLDFGGPVATSGNGGAGHDDTPGVSQAYVMDAINKAKSGDDIDVARDLITSIPDEQQRAECDVRARERIRELGTRAA